jgi:hypothetical protein
LYPPGKIIHIIPIGDEQWLPMWNRQEHFSEIKISTAMMKHHMPDFVQERLNDLVTNYENHNYHNWNPGQSSAHFFDLTTSNSITDAIYSSGALLTQEVTTDFSEEYYYPQPGEEEVIEIQ